MTSTINKTDGSILTVIADGTVDSTTNLVLIGKNYAGYGDFLNENFIHLLENAASTTAPENPLTGQLWWDKSNHTLKVWTGAQFKVISSSTSQDTSPANPVVGDLWWDTFNGQLNVFNGIGWTLIGPAFTTATGTSGTIVDSITDDNGDAHIVIKVFIEETLVAVISKDTSYSVNATVESDIYDSFATISPGINLASRAGISDISFNGTATDATTLANVAATSYARLDVPPVFTTPVSIRNSSGLTIGPNNTYTQTIVGNSVVLTNIVSDPAGDSFVMKANVSGIVTDVLTVNGDASVTVSTSPNLATSSDLTVATMKNIREVGGTEVLLRNGTRTITGNLTPNVASFYNLGSSTVRFKTFYSDSVVTSSVNAATVGNTGSVITGSSVSAATIGNTGAAITANTASLNSLTVSGNVNAGVGLNVPYATVSSAIYAANYYFANGSPFVPGVASLNSQLGALSISGTSGITVSTSGSAISVTPAAGYNGYGVRTVSTSGPSGGSNGDVWYQV